jgi:hypothetical protein
MFVFLLIFHRPRAPSTPLQSQSTEKQSSSASPIVGRPWCQPFRTPFLPLTPFLTSLLIKLNGHGKLKFGGNPGTMEKCGPAFRHRSTTSFPTLCTSETQSSLYARDFGRAKDIITDRVFADKFWNVSVRVDTKPIHRAQLASLSRFFLSRSPAFWSIEILFQSIYYIREDNSPPPPPAIPYRLLRASSCSTKTSRVYPITFSVYFPFYLKSIVKSIIPISLCR